MKILVIADIHLKRKDSKKNIIKKFLSEIASQYNKLIILGDFFEFWYGFEHIVISDYFEILHEFKKLIEQNTEIIYIEGNHDFCMGNFFKDLGIQVNDEYYKFSINEKNFTAMHGDTVNIENDKFYKILRKFLRSDFTKFLMNNLPASLILKIADNFSQSSRKYLFKDFDLKKIINSFRNKNSNDIILSGHFHKNFSYKNFYIIGDWSEDYNYLTIDSAGNINYQKFTF